MDYILTWQLLKKKEKGNAFSVVVGGAITISDIDGPLKNSPLLETAINLTASNIKESIHE